MKLKFYKAQLKMKETFSIAYGKYQHRNALLIELSHHEKKGYGECVEIDYYGIRLDDFIVKLKSIEKEIETPSISHPFEFNLKLKSLDLPSFLQSALDCAYWDLYGKLENKSFAELNRLSNTVSTESSITISIAPIEVQLKKINESSWSKFKVKCSSLDKNNLEKLLLTEKNIALDANASFTKDDCIWLQNCPISEHFTYIEQPMPIGKFNILDKNKFANWMADEDAQQLEDLEKLKPHYKSINIKLMKCGGLTPALELIQKAKDNDFKIMLGCMTESSVGISAACALAPLLDFADLDGANLIANDYAQGSFVKEGKIKISEKPGLGISLI